MNNEKIPNSQERGVESEKIAGMLRYIAEFAKRNPVRSSALIAALTAGSLVYLNKEDLSLQITRKVMHSPEMIDLYAWYRNYGKSVSNAEKEDVEDFTVGEENKITLQHPEKEKLSESISVASDLQSLFAGAVYDKFVPSEAAYGSNLMNYSLKSVAKPENPDLFKIDVLKVVQSGLKGTSKSRLQDSELEKLTNEQKAEVGQDVLQVLADYVSRLNYNKEVLATSDSLEFENLKGRKWVGNPITALYAANGEPVDRIFSGQVDTAVCRHKAETLAEAFKVVKEAYPSLFSNIYVAALPSPEHWHEYNMVMSQTSPNTMKLYGLDVTNGKQARHGDPTPDLLRLMWDRGMIQDREYFGMWSLLLDKDKYPEYRLAVLDSALNSNTKQAEEYAKVELSRLFRSLDKDYADLPDKESKEEFRLMLGEFNFRYNRFRKFFNTNIQAVDIPLLERRLENNH